MDGEMLEVVLSEIKTLFANWISIVVWLQLNG